MVISSGWRDQKAPVHSVIEELERHTHSLTGGSLIFEDCFPRIYFNNYLSIMNLVRISISLQILNI